jgi:hypothetical protein
MKFSMDRELTATDEWFGHVFISVSRPNLDAHLRSSHSHGFTQSTTASSAEVSQATSS